MSDDCDYQKENETLKEKTSSLESLCSHLVQREAELLTHRKALIIFSLQLLLALVIVVVHKLIKG